MSSSPRGGPVQRLVQIGADDGALRDATGRRARTYAERHLERERILSAFEARLAERVSGVGPDRDRAQPGTAGRRRMGRG